MVTYQDVLSFWFDELTPASWYKKDAQLDQLIQTRFGATHQAALACELFEWRARPEGRLAEIIVLDQFSRNIYRDDYRSFAADSLALALAQEAVAMTWDHQLALEQRPFIYMPFMHSESAKIHNLAVTLFSQQGMEQSLLFERRHKEIIDRFGRYPHRNAILQRESTAEELEFLQQPGSSF
ncbi:MAG: DUF924 domain-containing protein [Oleibacter sp.]|nr:DUF924 domain-containing protein [Thalassolituus sp.]